ncbi:hypothetical protein EWM64_g4294 [Hericium alpestre]|uniref:Uncharacterized protein n=1 Tax=Hericium alpestre TaxID=135208 RepID=A0A4Z0A0K0_9AGAM|nr:hypothetical protein EWM64_g4294 [Hericium alpestre]
MISAVVETSVDALASNAHERPYAPSVRSTALMPPPPTLQLSNEQRLAVQLIHLASQFHASAYSRANWSKGAALTYIPMSLHLPDHFKQLQDRQALSAQERAWWISDRRFTSESRAAIDERVGETTLPSQSSPVVTYRRPSLDIQNEISAAIEAPLAATATTGELPWKTSTSHPINISTIIPHELLSTISLHITLSDRCAPTMFNIHPAFSLDRITMPAIPANIPPPPPMPLEPIPQLPASDNCARDLQPSSVSQFIWNRSSMKHALEAALASDIKSPSDLTNGNLPARTPNNNTPARTPVNVGVFSIPRIPPLQFPDCNILGDVLATADDSTIGFPPSVLGKHERSYTAPPAVFKALIAEAISIKRHPQNSGLPAMADSPSR